MARGTHTLPSSWHLGPLETCLRDLATAVAVPASFRKAAWVSDEVTVISQAAGLPLSQSATRASVP